MIHYLQGLRWRGSGCGMRITPAHELGQYRRSQERRDYDHEYHGRKHGAVHSIEENPNIPLTYSQMVAEFGTFLAGVAIYP